MTNNQKAEAAWERYYRSHSSLHRRDTFLAGYWAALEDEQWAKLDGNLSPTEEHQHIWKLDEASDGSVVVIATYPPKYTYVCTCGARTHDSKTGTPCWCHL